ncbi:MAG: hypothetical protein KAG04_00635, partial [Mycoplasmataceae bacterium]|nr:hypothetical protein [Mycoplasmataceae bacterium]
FKWEDKRNIFGTTTKYKPHKDIWIPKAHTSRMFNENEAGKSYKSIKVNNLLIVPRYRISDVKMGYGAVAAKTTGALPYTKPYNKFASAKPDLVPSANDKWKWQYSDTGADGTWSDNSGNELHNGQVFWVKAVKLSDAFKLDLTYVTANPPRKFIVSGLTEMILTQYIPRPELKFEGFVGHGKILSVSPHIEGTRTQAYKSTTGKLDQPVGTGLGVDVHGGITWQFQVSNVNPTTISLLDIDKLPWKKTAPTTLEIGQYVRMRVAPIDPADGVEPPLYSFTDDKNAVTKDGWVRVKNLKVDEAKIGFEAVVGGFIGKTIITPKMLKGTIDELGVTMQAKVVSRKTPLTPKEIAAGAASIGVWGSFRELGDLKNGDVVSYRAIAITKNGYIIDSSQTNAFAAVGTPGSAGYEPAYIQKGSWKNQPIGSLKSFLDVDGVSLKTVHIIRDLRHPKPNDPLYFKQDPNDPKAKIPLAATDILSGSATISTDPASPTSDNANDKWATSLGTIVDVKNHPLPNGVRIQFTVQKYDPDSATYTEIAPSDTIPFGLKNMDRVKVELVPVNADKYKLSSERSIWITMKDLVQPSPKLNQPPILTFMGQNGQGTVLVTPIAQSGFKWVYNVQKIGDPETDVFVDKVPADLKNGDRVRVELASAIRGVVITGTYRTNFLTVSNLVFKFDMSNIKIDYPERIMNIIGKQEKDTKIHALAPSRLTSGGKVIEHTDKMKWKFLVVHEGDKNVPTHATEFKNALPEKLVNGDKVYAILISTDPDLEVIGFKPIMVEIKGLKPESKVSGKMSIMIMAIGGGILTAGLATAAVFIMKNRKKRML